MVEVEMNKLLRFCYNTHHYDIRESVMNRLIYIWFLYCQEKSCTKWFHIGIQSKAMFLNILNFMLTRMARFHLFSLHVYELIAICRGDFGLLDLFTWEKDIYTIRNSDPPFSVCIF